MSPASLRERVRALEKEAAEALDKLDSLDALQEWQLAFLGKKSAWGGFFGELKSLDDAEKQSVGPEINQARTRLQDLFDRSKTDMNFRALEAELVKDWIDTTKAFPQKRGGLHPLSIVQRKVEEIFVAMGFEIADGPEVESEWHNFDALNIPGNHPARDMQDTFFIKKETDDSRKNTVLRTHGTCIDIRKMCQKGVPIRTIAPARVFRNEALDATHDAVFYQVDGCLVGKDISLAHLKSALKTVLSYVFERDIQIRFRPGYFPFVEPGLEVDIWWEYVDKHGQEKGRWLEFCGAGMLHPNVLRHCDIDPEVYSGFAFGFGLTRLVMMKYGIEDIRHMFGHKRAFLEQFSS